MEINDKDATPQSLAKTEDYHTKYANSAKIDHTAWDFTFTFGQLDHTGPQMHTAITMPLAAAKLLAYCLEIGLMAYEHDNGPIRVPAAVVPERPKPTPEEANKMSGASQALYEVAGMLHKRFFGAPTEVVVPPLNSVN